ncbi:putative DNA-binding protein ESCAROLA-like, partial [Trifolium medium]|nr:putative DNA-binding protein ESCAROLA-like [Trifolium medium]
MDSRSPPPQPPQSTIMVGPTSYAPTNTSMISPNSSTTTATNLMAPATARFPFSSSQQSEPFSVTHDAPPSSPSTLAKKKRGRPRKYSPDGNIALGLAPTRVSSPAAATSASAGDSGNADAPPKKHRGRPPGSGKKQLDALGAGGTGFTPHVIVVESGE